MVIRRDRMMLRRLRTARLLLTLSAPVLVAASCGSAEERPSLSSAADGGGQAITTPVTEQTAAEQMCTKMDILFVIDNSGSMQEEQANLASNFSPSPRSSTRWW